MASNNLKRWLVAVLTGTMMLGIAGCSTSLEHSSSSEYIQMLDQGRLAGSGMPDDADKGPTLHGKRNIIQRFVLERRSGAVDMFQVFDL